MVLIYAMKLNKEISKTVPLQSDLQWVKFIRINILQGSDGLKSVEKQLS